MEQKFLSYILIIAISITSKNNNLFAQKEDDVCFQTGLSSSIYDTRRNYNADINVKYYVRDNWGLTYSFRIGYQPHGGLNARITLGSVGAALSALAAIQSIGQNTSDFWIGAGIVSMAIPDGVFYQVAKTKKTSADIFLQPLCWNFWATKPSKPITAYAGFNYNFEIGKNSNGITVFAGPSYQYTDKKIGVNIGLNYYIY